MEVEGIELTPHHDKSKLTLTFSGFGRRAPLSTLRIESTFAPPRGVSRNTLAFRRHHRSSNRRRRRNTCWVTVHPIEKGTSYNRILFDAIQNSTLLKYHRRNSREEKLNDRWAWLVKYNVYFLSDTFHRMLLIMNCFLSNQHKVKCNAHKMTKIYQGIPF